MSFDICWLSRPSATSQVLQVRCKTLCSPTRISWEVLRGDRLAWIGIRRLQGGILRPRATSQEAQVRYKALCSPTSISWEVLRSDRLAWIGILRPSVTIQRFCKAMESTSKQETGVTYGHAAKNTATRLRQANRGIKEVGIKDHEVRGVWHMMKERSRRTRCSRMHGTRGVWARGEGTPV